MRVAIVNLTEGSFSGGYAKYLAHCVPRIARDARVSELVMFSPPGAQLPPALAGISARSWPRGDRWQRYSALRAGLRDLHPDVVFIPTARWLHTRFPAVIMVRNMEPLLAPTGANAVSESLRNLARQRTARLSCRRATRIIAVSGFVHDVLTAQWRIPRHKIGVVYHGADERHPPQRPALAPAVPFVFTAGSIRPSRGLEDLLAAAGRRASEGRPVDIAIAGSVTGAAHGYAQKLARLAAQLRITGHVHWLGQLTAAEMSWCFAHASAFVMTTRVEACPNTALEALQHGTLCVAADNPPLPEFFGATALYYTPRDPEHLAQRIAQALSLGDTERRARSAAMRERVGTFTWERTADQTAAQLALAASSNVLA